MALSEPLINIRFTLIRARDAGIIDTGAHDALLAAARSVFYPKRTYRTIVNQAKDAIDENTSERFLQWVKSGACDQKRDDAVAALEYIKKIAVERE
jgi:hypothetical protein